MAPAQNIDPAVDLRGGAEILSVNANQTPIHRDASDVASRGMQHDGSRIALCGAYHSDPFPVENDEFGPLLKAEDAQLANESCRVYALPRRRASRRVGPGSRSPTRDSSSAPIRQLEQLASHAFDALDFGSKNGAWAHVGTPLSDALAPAPAIRVHRRPRRSRRPTHHAPPSQITTVDMESEASELIRSRNARSRDRHRNRIIRHTAYGYTA
ncbi:hypothetical protein B0H11DRAFT_2365496 [Mycena galericulata]|nr:hypothetical protein B0H11DRAFT_2365496 [Mycena galericulata]